MRNYIKSLVLFFTFFPLLISANEVNLYTSRHYESDITLYKKFENQTGIKVNVLSGKGKMLEKRIIEEDKNCIADVYIASDAGNLGSASSKGLFKEIDSIFLNNVTPSYLRTKFWYPITKRARVIFYSPDRVKASDLKNLRYEDLSHSKWRGRIAIRQSNNIYNQSLVASIIENNGLKKTKSWLSGFVLNFSKKPMGNDRAQILSVASGESDLAIANTYYYALMLSGLKGKEQQNAAQKVKIYFPNQNDRGVHVNISGGGILKYSPNEENALKFLEFLLTPEAQAHIMDNTYEYPINDKVIPNKMITKIGLEFKEDKITPMQALFKNQPLSLEIMTQAGWN